MAKKYQKRPSEILGIDDEYTAFCVDEVAIIYETQATDDRGNIKWNKLKWKNDTTSNNSNNKELINFIKKYHKNK